MSEILETVVVIRKDHPAGKVEINKSDLKPSDVLSQESKKQYVDSRKKG